MFFFHSKFCIFALCFGWMETRLLGKRRILSAGDVVRVFRKTGRRFCPKNTQGVSTDKRSMMFWVVIRSDGRKMLIKCPATLNSYGYLEISKQNDRHLNIPDLVFQQDNAPIHKSEVATKSTKIMN